MKGVKEWVVEGAQLLHRKLFVLEGLPMGYRWVSDELSGGMVLRGFKELRKGLSRGYLGVIW